MNNKPDPRPKVQARNNGREPPGPLMTPVQAWTDVVLVVMVVLMILKLL